MEAERILLIEGHNLMRSAVRDLLLQDGLKSLVEISDPIQAVGQVQQSAPAVIILDSAWTEVNGMWLTRLLRELAPQSKILLLLDDSRQDYQDAGRDSGANACIAKSKVATDLLPLLMQWHHDYIHPI